MDYAPSCQPTTERPKRNDLERSHAVAVETRKLMQIALQTYDLDDEKKKSRTPYQAQVQQRLKATEKDIESPIPIIIKQVEQVMSPRSDACIIS